MGCEAAAPGLRMRPQRRLVEGVRTGQGQQGPSTGHIGESLTRGLNSYTHGLSSRGVGGLESRLLQGRRALPPPVDHTAVLPPDRRRRLCLRPGLTARTSRIG